MSAPPKAGYSPQLAAATLNAPRPILRLDLVGKTFGGVEAVKPTSGIVLEGSITSLIGPNGAGKTTMFNMISGLVRPSTGRVVYYPKSGPVALSTLPAHKICDLGLARTFQNIRLFSDLPALDNVKVGFHCRTSQGLFGALWRRKAQREEEKDIDAAAFQVLEFVGLAHRAHETASSFSYGEQRLLEIARALASRPRLLLLDEPAAGMNPVEKSGLVMLIRNIRDTGISVFLIEHHMRLVMEISEHVMVLDHGEMIAEGPPAQVRANPRVIEAYLGAEDKPAEAPQKKASGILQPPQKKPSGIISPPTEKPPGNAPPDPKKSKIENDLDSAFEGLE